MTLLKVSNELWKLNINPTINSNSEGAQEIVLQQSHLSLDLTTSLLNGDQALQPNLATDDFFISN